MLRPHGWQLRICDFGLPPVSAPPKAVRLRIRFSVLRFVAQLAFHKPNLTKLLMQMLEIVEHCLTESETPKVLL